MKKVKGMISHDSIDMVKEDACISLKKGERIRLKRSIMPFRKSGKRIETDKDLNNKKR